MLLRIIVLGVVVIAAMAAIRDGRILRDAGLLSSCSAVATTGGKVEQTVMSCQKGHLDGFPDRPHAAAPDLAHEPIRAGIQAGLGGRSGLSGHARHGSRREARVLRVLAEARTPVRVLRPDSCVR